MVQIEGARVSLLTCPECKSSEGFWLITKRDAALAQCKHCGIISEASKVYIPRKKTKGFELVIKLRR